MIFYFEEPDEAGFRAELFTPEPLLLLAELFDVPVFPVIAFCAFPADADLVSPDLLPPDLLAIGVFAASLAPAVFLGAAALAEVPAFADPEAAAFDELPLLAPLFPAVDPDDVPVLFEEPAAVLDLPAELLDEPAEEPVLFDAVDLELPAADFDAAALAGALVAPDVLLSDLEPATASITDAAAPLTAPEAAPASTSPIASFVLS